MATAQQIYDQAVQRSNLNDPDLIPEAQWLDYITTLERRVFLTAARENPDFFGREGNTSARSSAATWSLTTAPGSVAAVTRIEIAAITGTVLGLTVGDEVSVISIREPDLALAPRVYLRDKVLTDYSGEMETDSSNFVTTLKIFYSLLPADRTATSDALDLPEEYNNLVVVPLAGILATRDQRPEEAQSLNQEFGLDWANFLQHISVFDEATIRELEQIPASSRRLSEGG